MTHLGKTVAFRAMHTAGRVLVLPNVWDVASACLAEDAGAAAIATTSAGVAWSIGAADGDQLERGRALDLIARVVAAVDVPVTADIESGYAKTPDGVGETIQAVLAAGAVGVNLEDVGAAGTPPLRPIEEQSERLAAARRAAEAAGTPLFVNARVDTYLRAVGDPNARFENTVTRASAYIAAGADGIFVPGVTDLVTVSALARAIGAPLNILVGPGAPTVEELAELGVARVSVGSSIALAAYALAQRGIRELLTAGTYASLVGGLSYHEVNRLLARRTAP